MASFNGMLSRLVGWSSENSALEVQEIDVSEWEGPGRFAILVHNVFSPDECRALIDRSEANGYERALVNIGNGRQMLLSDTRTSDRSIIDDPGLAEELWNRIVSHLGTDSRLMHRGSHFALGLNERLRFLRYDKGNFFAPHQDGKYVRGKEAGPDRQGEVSKVTCQLYLNQGFEGGATRFLSGRDESTGVDVVPRAGSVLLFEHRLRHEGSLLLEGRKYAIRTDVMYTNRADHENLTYVKKPIVLANSKSPDASVTA